MPHKVVSLPKKAVDFYAHQSPYSSTCQLEGVIEEGVSPCSHFDHCERKAVIWIYDTEVGPCVTGFCQQCYDYCYPTREEWYRVVKIAPEFQGKL